MKYVIGMLLALSMSIASAQSVVRVPHIEPLMRTPSAYGAVIDESTGTWHLCWQGIQQYAGIGNCMPVGQVWEKIRKSMTEYEKQQKEKSEIRL